MGKIIHGNKSFGFAPILASDDTYEFGSPVMIAGLVSATIEVEQEDTSVYADDKIFCTIKGAKVRTANVHFRNIPASYAPYLGFVQNANGGFTDTGTFANHCIFFETEEEDCDTGNATTTLHYLYNVRASEPTQESETDQDSVEPAEIEVEYSAQESTFVTDDNNVLCQYFYITRTAENANLYDTFKTAIIQPTDAIPASI